MTIEKYTAKRLIEIARGLYLDLEDSGMAHELAKHLHITNAVTDPSGMPCDYKTILKHTVLSLS